MELDPLHTLHAAKGPENKDEVREPEPLAGLHPFTGPFTKSAEKSSREKRHSGAFK